VCRFVKVKRLFMYMVEKHRHPWVGNLDLSRIDFGKGKRRIVSGGELNPKYEITVPREKREGGAAAERGPAERCHFGSQ
jgi:hypothetical protein